MEKTHSVIQFLYNADGIRTCKTVNNVEHVYTLNGNPIAKPPRLKLRRGGFVSESYGQALAARSLASRAASSSCMIAGT